MTPSFLVGPIAAVLAEGIDAALGSPPERVRRAGQGRALLYREYSVERYREKLEAAYATLR